MHDIALYFYTNYFPVITAVGVSMAGFSSVAWTTYWQVDAYGPEWRTVLLPILGGYGDGRAYVLLIHTGLFRSGKVGRPIGAAAVISAHSNGDGVTIKLRSGELRLQLFSARVSRVPYPPASPVSQ
jgi:hypothetical protein